MERENQISADIFRISYGIRYIGNYRFAIKYAENEKKGKYRLLLNASEAQQRIPRPQDCFSFWHSAVLPRVVCLRSAVTPRAARRCRVFPDPERASPTPNAYKRL